MASVVINFFLNAIGEPVKGIKYDIEKKKLNYRLFKKKRVIVFVCKVTVVYRSNIILGVTLVLSDYIVVTHSDLLLRVSG